MKRLTILLAVLLYSVTGALRAQNSAVLDALYEKMSDSAVSMDYSYTLQNSGFRTVGDGNVIVQDSSYVMKGNGLQINCEGKTMWIIDPEGKEVVIQPASEGEHAYMDNPALLFVNLPSAFNVDGIKRNGDVYTYVLSPKVSCGIVDAEVDLVSGTQPMISGARFSLSDGGELDIKIKSMTFSEKKPLTSFYYDVSGLDQSWLITDLR